MRPLLVLLICISCLLPSVSPAFASDRGAPCPEGLVPGCDEICGSNVSFDSCGVCNGNDEARGCDGVCFSNVTVDECGVCGGSGPGSCGCDLSLQADSCGVCGGPGPGECGCDRSVVKDECGVCGGDGTSCGIGPCAGADIAGVNFTSMKHDGIYTRFDGTSSRYDEADNLYYQYIRDGTIVGCIPNPNTQGLLDTFNSGGDIRLFTDLKRYGSAGGRSRNESEVRQQRLVDFLNGEFGHGPNSNSCFICAHVRKEKGCYPPEARLTTADGNIVTAAEVAAGDLLLNPLTGRSVEVLRVVEGPEELPLVGISFEGGYLRVSQDHPVLTAAGTKPAINVTDGDRLFDIDGKQLAVIGVAILPVDEGQRVINFILDAPSESDSDHMLLADGVVAGDLVLQWLLKERAQ